MIDKSLKERNWVWNPLTPNSFTRKVVYEVTSIAFPHLSVYHSCIAVADKNPVCKRYQSILQIMIWITIATAPHIAE